MGREDEVRRVVQAEQRVIIKVVAFREWLKVGLYHQEVGVQ